MESGCSRGECTRSLADICVSTTSRISVTTQRKLSEGDAGWQGRVPSRARAPTGHVCRVSRLEGPRDRDGCGTDQGAHRGVGRGDPKLVGGAGRRGVSRLRRSDVWRRQPFGNARLSKNDDTLSYDTCIHRLEVRCFLSLILLSSNIVCSRTRIV